MTEQKNSISVWHLKYNCFDGKGIREQITLKIYNKDSQVNAREADLGVCNITNTRNLV